MPKTKKPAADPKLLEALVCPLTQTTLVFDKKNSELVSVKAGLAYPVNDGVPVMVPSQARPLSKSELAKLKR